MAEKIERPRREREHEAQESATTRDFCAKAADFPAKARNCRKPRRNSENCAYSGGGTFLPPRIAHKGFDEAFEHASNGYRRAVLGATWREPARF
jgi:triphosphoribosyl-dephospho-CoA synthetase